MDCSFYRSGFLLGLHYCDATSNHCPSLNTRSGYCSVADEKPLHWGCRYACWEISQRDHNITELQPRPLPTLCVLSLVNSWSNSPWKSDRCPGLPLPHLWPCPDTKRWWNPLSLPGTVMPCSTQKLWSQSYWVMFLERSFGVKTSILSSCAVFPLHLSTVNSLCIKGGGCLVILHATDNSKTVGMGYVEAVITFMIICHRAAVMLCLVLEKRHLEVEKGGNCFYTE